MRIPYQLLHRTDLFGKLVETVPVIRAGRGVVHLFDTNNHHLDVQKVDQMSVLTGLSLILASGMVTLATAFWKSPTLAETVRVQYQPA